MAATRRAYGSTACDDRLRSRADAGLRVTRRRRRRRGLRRVFLTQRLVGLADGEVRIGRQGDDVHELPQQSFHGFPLRGIRGDLLRTRTPNVTWRAGRDASSPGWFVPAATSGSAIRSPHTRATLLARLAQVDADGRAAAEADPDPRHRAAAEPWELAHDAQAATAVVVRIRAEQPAAEQGDAEITERRRRLRGGRLRWGRRLRPDDRRREAVEEPEVGRRSVDRVVEED